MKKTSAGGSVFRIRNYRLVFLGALVSELGALMYDFAVSFYLLELSGNDAFLQGLYLALCGVTMLLFTPIGGILGDRFNKARIMAFCDLAKGTMILAGALLMPMLPGPDARIALLFILGIPGNMIAGIFSPASGALIPHIVGTEQLQQAISFLSLKSATESILGVVLAGVLYAALPIRTLLAAVGCSFLLSGISELWIRYPFIPSAERLTLRLALSDLRGGFSYLKGRRAHLTLIGGALAFNFFFSPVFANFIPYFIRTDLAGAAHYLLEGLLTPELWSSVFSVCLGAGSLVGSAILSARKPTDRPGRTITRTASLNAALLITVSAAYLLLVRGRRSLNGFLILCSLASCLIGLLLSFTNVPLSTLVTRITDRDMLSKVTSIMSTGAQGLVPLSSVIAGAILSGSGSSALLIFCSGGLAGASVLLLRSKELQRL